MKRRLLSIIMAAILVASLVGCGGKKAETEEKEPETTVQATQQDADKKETSKTVEEEEDTASVQTGAVDFAYENDGESDITDITTGKKLPTHNGATVIYTNTELEVKDEYLISDVVSELMTDRAITRGWDYYYIDSEEDNAEIITWTPKDGNFTSAVVVFYVTNLNDTPIIYGDTIKGRIVFDEGGKNKVYEGVAFQSNPGQIDSWGYENTRNATFKEIKKDERSLFSVIVDVDKEFHDAMVADEVKEPTWAYIDFDNGDKYCLNLRSEMIIFGYDDSEPESLITDDIHRTMKAATGTEYMTEFLSNSSDFMQLADLAKIDVNKLAEGYASQFSIKVYDIIFDDDTHATAYCTVTSPDFVTMYKDLDVISAKEMEGIDPSQMTEEEYYQMSGQMLVDYTDNPNFPTMDRELEIQYEYDEAIEKWTPLDKESVVNEMRIALMNF